MTDPVATLLPGWVRIVWAVVLAVALVVHLRHVAGHGAQRSWTSGGRTGGQSRWWHATYASVAIGMIVMYLLNPMTEPGLTGVALVVFVLAVAALVALTATTLVLRQREGRLNPLWVVAAVDALTVAYTQIPNTVRPIPVCVVFAIYLATQVVAWPLGAWWTRGGAVIGSGSTPVSRPTEPGGHASTATVTRTEAAAADRRPGFDLPKQGTLVIRFSTALIMLGMLYMISI